MSPYSQETTNNKKPKSWKDNLKPSDFSISEGFSENSLFEFHDERDSKNKKHKKLKSPKKASKRACKLARQSTCLLYTSPSPRDATLSRMPSSA